MEIGVKMLTIFKTFRLIKLNKQKFMDKIKLWHIIQEPKTIIRS